MNISLPDEMRAWVEGEVRGGGFSSASEYFRQLVREAKVQKERAERERKKAELEALLVEGIESGPAMPITPQWWGELLNEVDEKLKQKGVDSGLRQAFQEDLEEQGSPQGANSA